MAEKLTKTAIKNELQRRIDWLEHAYGFKDGEAINGGEMNENALIAYGRYLALRDCKWQIENNLFIGGFAC